LVEVPEVDIGIRHGSYQRKNDGPLRLFAGQHVGARRLRGSSQLAPEIDLPGGVDKKLKIIEIRKRIDGIFKRRGPGYLAQSLPAGGCGHRRLRGKTRTGGGVKTQRM